jgi:hypothetical protein
MTSLEAKRTYVEALLNVATEVNVNHPSTHPPPPSKLRVKIANAHLLKTLKRSNDVTQAQNIIQAFSTMRPSGDETDSYDEEGGKTLWRT